MAQEEVVAPVSVPPADTLSCTLSGRVVDENQSPLPFVTIKVEGQMAGTVTNPDGRYSFSFATADSIVVNYTLIGYEKKTKTLKHPQGKLVWNVTMRSSGTEMGELVVKEGRRQ